MSVYANNIKNHT